MELSYTCNPLKRDRFRFMASIGVTACEPQLAPLCAMGETEAKEFHSFLQSLGLHTVSFNSMLPKEIALFGESYDENALREFAEKEFYIASFFEAPLMTFGSGGARNIPDGMDRKEAEKHFLDILSILVPIAEKNGLHFAIEPLKAAETNYLNNCREIAAVLDRAPVPVYLTLDAYHAYLGGDTNADFTRLKEKIRHVHIASVRNNRAFPGPDDTEDLSGLFQTLKAMHYTGAISVEPSSTNDFEGECKRSFDYLSALMKTI